MFPGEIFNSRESQERWVKHITRNYTVDLGTHPFVYQVPRSLRDTKPEAYTPQALGLGPYHHFRPEVQQMESQKRAEVKDYLKVTKLQEFIDFVRKFRLKEESEGPSLPHSEQKFESRILSFYDRYLDLDSGTLAWVVVIDGIFLLHFLNEESKWKDQRLIADIMMLENQIPLFLLQEVRKALRDSFPHAADIQLLDQFCRFCAQQSPLELSDRPRLKKAAFEKHMLHFMYMLIVNNYEVEEGRTEEGGNGQGTDGASQEPSASCLSNMNGLAHQVISNVGRVFYEIVKMVTSGTQQAEAQGLNIPPNIKKELTLLEQLKTTSDLYNKSDKNDKRVADKIEVPSVSQLYSIAKIKFAITKGGIRNIRLHGSTIYLPEIRLGENTEVVLRNLLAYEAAAKPGQTPELAEYVDLMCGIIDAEIDVELLKYFGIIKGNLAKEEIVRIFNGINKSTQWSDQESEVQNNGKSEEKKSEVQKQESEVQKKEFEVQKGESEEQEESEVRKAVRQVNKKFNNLRTVKAYKFIKNGFAALQSWIKRLFPILVLMFLALQSFCEIYGCSSHRFGYAAVPAASSVVDGPSFGLDAEAKLMLPRKFLPYTG